MMDSDNDTVSKLKFIGKIQSGEKINSRKLFVQPVGMLTSFSRTVLDQDNRSNALEFVKNTIDKSILLLEKYKDTNKNLFDNIMTDLVLSKKGITNLKDTYISDVKFCCDMDIVLQHIDAMINEFGCGHIQVDQQQKVSEPSIQMS